MNSSKNPSFLGLEFKNGPLHDDSKAEYPSAFHALTGENTFDLVPGSTYFVYQHSGTGWINLEYPLKPGCYAAITHQEHSVNIITGNLGAEILIIERIHRAGELPAPFQLGGPVEEVGRLKYIDGCTDSLLISPWKLGEACLNHLHFPPGIDQTAHTHPSIRIGMVIRGRGECVTPFGNAALVPGTLFCILPSEGNNEEGWTAATGLDGQDHPIGTHAFRTFSEGMDVIAFHPDSDFGPSDEEHPMINRTIVEGVSAKHIDEIRTK